MVRFVRAFRGLVRIGGRGSWCAPRADWGVHHYVPEHPTDTGVAIMRLYLAVGTAAMWTAFVLSATVLARDIDVPQSSAFATSWNRTNFDHALWSAVLYEHVDDHGLVNYAAIGRDVRYLEYLHRLANTDPAALASDKERLAFWVNAYNALAIQGVIATLPGDTTSWPDYSVVRVDVPGVREKGKGFFMGLRFVVGGRRYTLDEIEKAVILQKPLREQADRRHYRAVGVGRSDPRIHFALVCCAKGCPVLQRRAYKAIGLETQLADAVRMFLKDSAKARFDKARRTVYLSQLIDWYKADLTNKNMSPSATTVLEFLAHYVDDPLLARSLSADQWSISYIDYDWTLNLKR